MVEPSLAVRSRRAAQMFARGHSFAEVARAIGVTRETAKRWYREWRTSGRAALQRRVETGSTQPDRRELERVISSVRKGATLDEVARVIEEQTGRRYHPGHVWRLIRRLGLPAHFDPGRYEL